MLKRKSAWAPPPRVPATPLARAPNYAPASNDVTAVPKEVIHRSEAYRRYVATHECFPCRIVGYSQCAHENVGKGMGLKVCDSRAFPACGPHHGLIGCHAQFDLGIDCDRDERRALGAKYVAEMQARAVADGWKFTAQGITR